MKRSALNDILRSGDSFVRSFGYALPPFANWTPADFALEPQITQYIVGRGLGWDVTDYGQGRFDELGLFLFTVRNGRAADLDAGRGMLYAEKIMISRRDQLSPMHRHNIKAEDIINRGGGDLVIELFASCKDGSIDDTQDVTVNCDGRRRTVSPGGKIRLKPGESVTLLPGVWHAFWAERSDVLIGEVSTVNDDVTDNVFREPVGRFASIQEDAEPWRLLVSDYGTFPDAC
ncbi:MAG: D-lyxose/D-mannose family sugar isomerase [Hyphomicrobiaceae bacterium]